DSAGYLHEQREDLGAANYGDWLVPAEPQRLVDFVRDLRAVGAPAAVAGEDDVTASGEKAGKAFERLAAHHHRAAHRQLLEALQVGRNVPGQLAVAADYAVLGPGDDERDAGFVHAAHLPVSRTPAKHAICSA